MGSYDSVISTLRDIDLSWSDLERVELHEETYTEFTERANFPTGNFSVGPVVRRTNGTEKIIYIDDAGELVEVDIS